MSAPGRFNQQWSVFRGPIVLALLSAVGLGAALVGDGWLDVLSWITLSVPLLVILWAFRRGSSS
jgi:hypothetical protein